MKHQYHTQLVSGLKIATLIAIAFSATLANSPAGGKNNNPTVIPYTPGTAKKYSKLSAAWEQWRFGIIADTGLDPFSDDPTGALCELNQSGNVWFLAGAPLDTVDPVVRECTIPTGTFVHFPILNVPWITVDADEAAFITVEENFQDVNDTIEGLLADPSVTLHVEVDGKVLGNLFDYYVQSPIFELDNFGSLADGFLNFDYGYYILLAPLSAGEHTIHIASTLSFFGNPFAVDVTYNLTVVGGKH